MFRRVLVANRGEIARRVMATCRGLGIETVAVYSDADAAAAHVREADEAVHLGPAKATESYLDIDRVIAAAQRTGADAIHPGYGFLSENAEFAAAIAETDITFVGPAAETIRLMGDKAAAKRHLAAAGVPVVPGTEDLDLAPEDLPQAAEKLGYPILVKAVAGGGGKGMRTVHDPGTLGDAVEAAKREAAASFGDDRIILEKLVPAPRHIEVQVFGDSHGNVVHVFERECSIQRRHQKVVEEAPATIPDELRQQIAQAGVRAAEAVDYLGAGTVEFLLSDETHDFYFLEMNTRLQVEHPVTELITGLDLVEWQLRVAAGEPLPLEQTQITAEGHAIEVRLYAEDPANDYLPQTGPVHRFLRPDATDVRIDTGVEDGDEVTRFYDPMLAKLVVRGDDRSSAIDRMLWLLERSAVLGVTTNLAFLADVVAEPAFRRGELTTSFLDDHLPGWQPQPAPIELLPAAAVAIQHDRERPGTRR
ncbi:MAG: biotin carboxylase N-terminal domain-containing protein, partial [Nitriliruptorales bacterium]|nr:biotin carboxylase N-terminal domain-containing protein [Nitriliruptorales bacterium]